MWGILWSNRSTRQIRLLYSLANIMNVDFIPAHIEELYGMKEETRMKWVNWLNEPSVETVPNVPCPIWKETLQTLS